MSASGALGGLAGSRLGSAAGGARVGRSIGARLSKMFGCGDYVVNDMPVANSLIKGPQSRNAYPTFGNNGQSTRIQHREFLFDLSQGATAGVFTNTTLPINPGLIASFPYLAPIAANFEEYRINGLVFEFISTTSPYLAGGAMGSVIMSMQYNPLTPAFTSKVQMENSDFAISARPDQTMIYGVECALNTQNMYLVRMGLPTAPLTSTDLGLMQFAVQSPIAANTVIGEIWVSYDIELMRPKAQTWAPGYAHLSGALTAAAGAAAPLTTVQASMGTLSGISIVSTATAGTYTVQLPALPTNTGLAVSTVLRYAGATAASGIPIISCTNSVVANTLGNGVIVDSTNTTTGYGVGSTVQEVIFLVTGAPVLTFALPASPAGSTSQTVDIVINLLSYGLTAAGL